MSLFKNTRNSIEKIDEVISKKESLEKEFEDLLGKFTYDGKDIIVYERFLVENLEIFIQWRDFTISEDRIFTTKYSLLQMKYGDKFLNNHRSNFCRIKHQLKIFGYKITKDE